MLTVHLILALGAVAVLSFRPKSAAWTSAIVVAAVVDVVLGTAAAPALEVVISLLAFLAAALTLAALAERSGLAQRAAAALAACARGHTLALYALVCGLCVLLTEAVSLDGAVVLIVPVMLTLAREYKAPFAPLFLGAVAVANSASMIVPQGNPTNLVVMSRLHLSSTAFVGHMLWPGLAATAVCAVGVAVFERRHLACRYTAPTFIWTPLSAAERSAARALGAAALAAWLSPLFGVAPWWPFAGAVALALLLQREKTKLLVPWRVAAQVGGLLILTQALALHPSSSPSLRLAGLVAVALGVGAASAMANNLPVGVSATALLIGGPMAYAASIGLAAGALATPHGSVATLIASEAAGSSAPRVAVRRFAPLAASAVLVATVSLWLTQ